MNVRVERIPAKEAEPWIIKKHYAHRLPSITHAFGLYDGIILIGVCCYGTPASSTLLRGVCGEKWKNNVCELNRLVLRDNIPNQASMLVSRSIKLLPKPMIIVSYADTSHGHVGYVYQACNFLYTGLSSKFLDPKVKGLEHQHHCTYAHGMNTQELKEKFGDKLYFEERARKHRYVFVSANKKDKKEIMSSLNYEILPYPKGESKRYDASAKVEIQALLF